MEQKERIEKPDWVNVIETLPEILRQALGNQCANVIASLVNFYLIDPALFSAVVAESQKMIEDYSLGLENRIKASADCSVSEIVEDSNHGKLHS